ncbi:MAG: 30S ribosome-binding factor RbfA [Patescibacteria group bacterium]
MNKRISKVNELLIKEIGQIISRDLELPTSYFVTVTKVKTSNDLKLTRVFISVIPDDRQDAALKFLENRRGYINKLLGQNISLKFTPKVSFFIDDLEEKAAQIEGLIDNVSKNQ